VKPTPFEAVSFAHGLFTADHPAAPYVAAILRRYEHKAPRHWVGMTPFLTDALSRAPQSNATERYNEARRVGLAFRRRVAAQLRQYATGADR
jgi:hypothetical protein